MSRVKRITQNGIKIVHKKLCRILTPGGSYVIPTGRDEIMSQLKKAVFSFPCLPKKNGVITTGLLYTYMVVLLIFFGESFPLSTLHHAF